MTRETTQIRKRTYAKALFFSCVFVFLFAFFGVGPAEAGEATLKIDPPQGTFYVGSSFDVSIILDTGGETINALETELRFPQNMLQVTSPTAARSFVAIWTSPPSYSNQDGFVRFQGGIPSPGLKTSQGVLSTISFRATQPGTIVLELRDSRVLLADGSGTNIFSRAFGARYTIAIPPPQGPTVSSVTHPEFTKWYRDKFVAFSWNKDERVTDFSWSFDQNPNGVPDVEPEGGETSVSYENLKDGIWYFHIRAKQGDVWGGVTTFSVKIDTEPSAQFLVELDPKDTVTVKTRVSAVYRTTDRLSGIGRYEVNIVNVSGPGETYGSTFFVEGESPYRLPELPVGVYTVIVRAYDVAGNFQESSATLEIRESTFAPFLTEGLNLGFKVVRWALVILPLVGGSVFFGLLVARFWKKHRHIRRVTKETGKGLNKLQERFQEEIKGIEGKVSTDHALNIKSRLDEQLKRFSDITEESARVREQRAGTGIFGRRLKMIIIGIFFVTPLFFAGGSDLARAEPQDVSIPVPKILTHQVEIASNQLLYVTGLALPGSFVTIYISGGNQETIKVETTADKNGEWEHLHDLYLQPGFFQMRAEAQSPDGTTSKTSDPVHFRVTSRLVGSERALGTEDIMGILVVFFALINIGFLGALLYFWHRSRLMRKGIQKEVQEVHDALQMGFDIIAHELEEDLALLEKNVIGKSNKEALVKERRLRKSLLQDIRNIEDSIQKEVSDIRRSLSLF